MTALVGCFVSRVIAGEVADRVAGDCWVEFADWLMAARTEGKRDVVRCTVPCWFIL